ncbi:MAG: VanW family protein [Bacilli bacterium]|nr:VanW family protein [Bacilli bacterium]
MSFINNSKEKLIVLLSLLFILILSYVGLVIYNNKSLKEYDNKILPNTYIEDFDMSYYTYDNSKEKLEYSKDYITSKKIKVNVNSKEFEYSLNDLGLTINIDETLRKIKDNQKKLDYSTKLMMINGTKKSKYSFIYDIDNEKLKNTLNTLKGEIDYNAVNAYFDTSDGVVYKDGEDGFSLNIDNSIKNITEEIKKGINEKTNISLAGDIIEAYRNDSYKDIDTMTSSFSTVFMPNTYMRNINLNYALNLINGTVVEPGEIFSYCDTAGPFTRYGYVFYYEFVGNGVCQIATTTYNAALLGGLEIVKRYPHAKKSLYVAGGLDATVASYSSGWCVDMQFKNTYKYPIYIKAYSYNGVAYVEFWSNHDAKGGLEYTTSSVQIGQRGYKSYLHTWKDGEEIDVHEIDTTWYIED